MLKYLLIVCLCLNSTNGFAAKKNEAAKDQVNAKNELSDLHEKIDVLKKELDSKQEAHKDATDALKDSETAISSANKKLREITESSSNMKDYIILYAFVKIIIPHLS